MAGAAPSMGGDQVPSQEDSRVIECPQSVLQAIGSAALDRVSSAADGGELIGVLFGTHDGDQVRIAAMRPLTANIKLQDAGPLPVEEHEAFASLAAETQSGGELAALEPVGWFRSHPGSELGLSERNLEITNTLFPHSWQIVMILRPCASAPSCVRFYFRESDAALTVASPFQEFTVPLTTQAPPPPEMPPTAGYQQGLDTPYRAEDPLLQELRNAMGTREEAAEPVPERSFPTKLPAPEAPVFPLRRPRIARRPVAFGWPTGLMVAASLLAALYWVVRSPARLALRVFDNGGQLRVAWDPIQKVDGAHLEITDGNAKLWIELDPALVRNGSFTYGRRSGNVIVRLVVERRGATALEETTRFLGAEGQASDVQAAQNPPEGKQPGPVSLPPQKPAELIVSVPLRQDTPAKARPKFTAPAVTAPRLGPVNGLSAPEPAPVVVARDAPSALLPSAVRVALPPAEKPRPSSPVPQQPSTPVQEAGRPPAAPPRAPAAATSGRLIWIGRLQKNQALTIDGKNCSTGTLIGELPAKPVKFSVSPGDLSSDGIVLYTANLQYANNVVEPPGAQNGWNKTVYTWDPKHAGDVTVAEAPAAQNQWSHFVLRSKSPKISVIVIDWSTVN